MLARIRWISWLWTKRARRRRTIDRRRSRATRDIRTKLEARHGSSNPDADAKIEPDPHRPTFIQTIRDIGYRFETD
jgi:hypothetical protein